VFPGRGPTAGGAEALSRSSLKETPFANGWLCFESDGAKRRLAPIPPGWEFATGKVMEELWQQATAVPARRQGRFAAGIERAEAEAPGAA